MSVTCVALSLALPALLIEIIEVGSDVPEFTLQGYEGPITRDDMQGDTTILVFHPYAFSGVGTDQLQIYDRAWDRFQAAGATKIYGASTDPTYSQHAFKEQLGVGIEQLSDFESKGEVARAFGAYFEPGGMTNRAIVIVNPDLTVKFSHLAESSGDLPPLELLVEGLTGGMADAEQAKSAAIGAGPACSRPRWLFVPGAGSRRRRCRPCRCRPGGRSSPRPATPRRVSHPPPGGGTRDRRVR